MGALRRKLSNSSADFAAALPIPIPDPRLCIGPFQVNKNQMLLSKMKQIDTFAPRASVHMPCNRNKRVHVISHGDARCLKNRSEGAKSSCHNRTGC